jgi:protein-S-isoprenylcysteine O-methyltransferase
MCQPGYKGYSSKWDGTQKVFKVFGYALSISSILILFVMWQWEINWISIVISSIGLVLQRWARETLGSYYTIKLCIQPGQKLIKTGPYKYMDHPGYLGMVLFVVGSV